MEGHPEGGPCPSKEPVILDAKPLRALAPMFPAPFGFNTFSPPGDRPFVCVTPFSSFASGSESGPPFPNFQFPRAPDQRPANPAPMGTRNGATNGSLHTEPSLSPVQTPPTVVVPLDGGDDPLFSTSSSASGRKTKQPLPLNSCEMGNSRAEGTAGKRKKVKRKRPKKYDEDLLLLPYSPHDAKESVNVVLMTFDALRRRLSQLDEANGLGLNQRPDLKAGSIMINKDLRANNMKRIGQVPGIEVGDHFYFRIEMCLVGLHSQTIAGIDYMNARFGDDDDHVALSIVSAGGYENVDESVDALVYSGQGGGGGHGKKSDKKQMDNQKLERGNLALERSLHRANEIRVIRSEKDANGKIYIYDGLYKIHESWVEKGKSGFNIFKYKLLREPGQPDGITVWKMTQKWKENPSSRGKVILPDISSGMENIPVVLVNDVDHEKGPSHFIYATKVDYLSRISSMKPFQGCTSHSTCLPGDANCSCVQRNGGDLPFGLNDLLVSRKPLIYECGDACECTVNCRNRVTQKGIRLHFEVFKTRDRGWGLRSWDPIRAGTFICEYIGEVVDKIKVEEDGEEDEYIFHTMNADDKAFRWNYGPELLGEASRVESSELSKPLPIILSAKKMGNISRFMNHSCSPNVFWQPVQHDHDDEGYPHIMFFSTKHIPPMAELTYDYGLSGGEFGPEMGSRVSSHRIKKCLCGSSNCRGSFG